MPLGRSRKLNETHQLLAYADDVNVLVGNRDTVNKNTGTLIDASKEECILKSGYKNSKQII
jgi:hypothetical protein